MSVRAWFSASQAQREVDRADGVPYGVHVSTDGLHAVLATGVGDGMTLWPDAIPLGFVDLHVGDPARPFPKGTPYPGRRITQGELRGLYLTTWPIPHPLVVPVSEAVRLVGFHLSGRELLEATRLAMRVALGAADSSPVTPIGALHYYFRSEINFH